MFGKEQDQITQFPDIPEDYFAIKDSNTLKELQSLYEQSKTQQQPFQIKGTQECKSKQQELQSIYDSIDKSINHSDKPDIFQECDYQAPYSNFDYYDLSHISYNQVEAHEIAQQLMIQSKIEKMSLEPKPKPQYEKSLSKQMKQIQLLSFQDEY